MASSISLASPILLVILFHLFLENYRTCFASNPTGKTPTGLSLTLTRVDFGKYLPKNQYGPSSLNEATPLPPLKFHMKASSDLYVTKLAIGTPPVTFSGVVDTGSDLIWTKCQSSSHSYDSSKSITFSKVEESCDSFNLDGCEQRYADGMSITVSMGREVLTTGGMSINFTFACGTPKDKNSVMYDGIIGMGRGKLSLVSQLNESVFSYCLASRFHGSEQSILLTGDKTITAVSNTQIQTTPLLNKGDSYYYISLEGISVGETKLAIDQSAFAIKNGGMIIDSGTTFTYLDESIINLIEDAFMNQTKLDKFHGDMGYNGLNRCFTYSFNDEKIIPKLVFHFTGANWDLPRENYMYTKNGAACLAFMPIDKNDQQVSIFGNMQQQNMMVRYDLGKNSLSFMPSNCNQL